MLLSGGLSLKAHSSRLRPESVHITWQHLKTLHVCVSTNTAAVSSHTLFSHSWPEICWLLRVHLLLSHTATPTLAQSRGCCILTLRDLTCSAALFPSSLSLSISLPSCLPWQRAYPFQPLFLPFPLRRGGEIFLRLPEQKATLYIWKLLPIDDLRSFPQLCI